jgi:hypothetical protein
VLIGVDHGHRPTPARHLDRDQLVGEPTGTLGGDGLAVRGQRERVLVLPGDAELGPQVLGRLDHPSRDGVVHTAGRDAPAGEAVVQLARAAQTVAGAEEVVLDPGHRLRAAGDDDVGDAGLHPHGGRRGRPGGPAPHRRSTCAPGTLTGRPASRAATRPSAGASPFG